MSQVKHKSHKDPSYPGKKCKHNKKVDVLRESGWQQLVRTGAFMVGSGKDFESNPEMEDEIFGLDSGGNGNNKWNVVENRNRMKSWCNVL